MESLETFQDKMRLCSRKFDYTNSSNWQGKQDRLRAANDVLEMLRAPVTAELLIRNLDEVMDMIQVNLFRPLPRLRKTNLETKETGNPRAYKEDPAWPHLRPIYEILSHIVTGEVFTVRLLKVYLTPKFIQEFIALFDSEEEKEREILRTILYRLYAKVVPRRKKIREALFELLFSLVHEKPRFNGTAELFETMNAIVSGYALPLRDEHVLFFKVVVVPLYQVETCQSFAE